MIFCFIYLLLIPSNIFFILVIVVSISDWLFFYVPYLIVEVLTKFIYASLEFIKNPITSVLNSLSDRLLVSVSLSSFSGVLFWSCIWEIFLCLFILSVSLCCYELGKTAISSGLEAVTLCRSQLHKTKPVGLLFFSLSLFS